MPSTEQDQKQMTVSSISPRNQHLLDSSKYHKAAVKKLRINKINSGVNFTVDGSQINIVNIYKQKSPDKIIQSFKLDDH